MLRLVDLNLSDNRIDFLAGPLLSMVDSLQRM